MKTISCFVVSQHRLFNEYLVSASGNPALVIRRKKHTEKEVHAHLISVVSVRLREGYTIRDINLSKGKCLSLPKVSDVWKVQEQIVQKDSAVWDLSSCWEWSSCFLQVGLSWRWSWFCYGNTTCTLSTWQPPPGLWTRPREPRGWKWRWREATTSCMTSAARKGNPSPAHTAPPSSVASGTHCRGTTCDTRGCVQSICRP